MKILVIFTGGTIGSRLNNMEISPDESAKYLLIEEYRKHYGNEVAFSFLEPYIILSENITAEKINLLIQTIRENIYALPIEVKFLDNDAEKFNENIYNYVTENSRNS